MKQILLLALLALFLPIIACNQDDKPKNVVDQYGMTDSDRQKYKDAFSGDVLKEAIKANSTPESK